MSRGQQGPGRHRRWTTDKQPGVKQRETETEGTDRQGTCCCVVMAALQVGRAMGARLR